MELAESVPIERERDTDITYDCQLRFMTIEINAINTCSVRLFVLINTKTMHGFL